MEETRRGAHVQIGEAAALYGLAPSALRWWEKQGVLPEPDQNGGRRTYSEADLRRIGLAYLCAVTGRMPLDQAAIVTSGDTQNGEWLEAVRGHIKRLDEQCARLQAARDYLTHLLLCTSDDPTTDCPYLDEELVKHTPRGRFAEADLIDAARRSRTLLPRLDSNQQPFG